ncbi:GTP-binding protein, partial [Porcipelethomonas sp.]|uniref:GTP-binding protein n=1 Tax=Porcipelethomonas sp. TaxID=2981675 RepID=UPI003078DEF5
MKRIKNITLAGHNGSGKTSLAEALLYKVGVSDRLGKTTDGTTIMDFDPEEVKRKISIGSSAAAFDYEDIKVNLIDTPGLFDFAVEMIQGISAADTVMITVSAKSGVKVGTKKAYKEAVKQNKSKMFVVTKIDDENANFYNVLTELKTVFGPTVCPVVVPVIENEKIASYVNLIEMKAYKYDDKGNTIETEMPEIEKMTYRIDGLLEAVSEAVAETDEALMEKFFEGEPFTQKELIDGIHNGMNNGIITPVVCTSAVNLSGIDMLLKEIALLIPSADESEPIEAALGDDLIQIKCTTEEPLSAFVFKTVADPFIGKVSYIKVMSGILKADSTVFNSSTGENEKIGKLYFMKGKQQTETSEATAGDIVTAVKINASTFDTLCSPERKVLFEKLSLPVPCYSMAVCSAQGDESKISTGIQRILDEDKTLKYEQNESTK